MNRHNQMDRFTTQDAETAEERGLSRALERTRLEKAAARPSFFLDGWSLSVLIGIAVVLYLQGRHSEYYWLIPLLILRLIYSVYAGVHSRIDALLELERLRTVSSCPAEAPARRHLHI